MLCCLRKQILNFFFFFILRSGQTMLGILFFYFHFEFRFLINFFFFFSRNNFKKIPKCWSH